MQNNKLIEIFKTKDKKSVESLVSFVIILIITVVAINIIIADDNKKESATNTNKQLANEEVATSTAPSNSQVIEEEETDPQSEETKEVEVADIGDAELVSSNDVVTDDYFANSKIERNQMYSQMLEVYQKIIDSASSQEAQKQSATDEIQKINNTKNSIMICENLIKSKGFDDNVVLVNGDNVNVIVGTVELEKEGVAQIQNIIENEFKVEAKNIHISIKWRNAPIYAITNDCKSGCKYFLIS